MSNAAAQKKSKANKKPAEHPTYNEMIAAAVTALKERNGSSRQAIVKYIKANYKVGDNSEVHVKLALKRMAANGKLVHTKGTGASGSFKLVKAAASEKKPKKKVVKKPAAKKAAAKKPAAKKAAAKKPAAKKPAAKKAATKSPKKPKKAAKKPAAKAKAGAKKPAAKKPAAKKAGKAKTGAKKSAKK